MIRSRRERTLLWAVWTCLAVAAAALLVLTLIPPHHQRGWTLAMLAVMFSCVGLAGVLSLVGLALYGNRR